MGIEYGENNNNVYDTCIFASENRLYPQNGHLNDKLIIKQKKKRLTVPDFQTMQNVHWFFYLVSVWKFPGHFSIEHPVVLGNPLLWNTHCWLLVHFGVRGRYAGPLGIVNKNTNPSLRKHNWSCHGNRDGTWYTPTIGKRWKVRV